MTERANFAAALAASRIPDYMKGGVSRYMMNGIPPGDFLTNLLSNDLRRTFERADSDNQAAVMDYLQLLYNHAPSQAWGSAQNVKDWIELRGWHGLEARFAAAAAAPGGEE